MRFQLARKYFSKQQNHQDCTVETPSFSYGEETRLSLPFADNFCYNLPRREVNFMYFSVKQQIAGMSVREYQTLRLLYRLSKNLYNESLYSVR